MGSFLGESLWTIFDCFLEGLALESFVVGMFPNGGGGSSSTEGIPSRMRRGVCRRLNRRPRGGDNFLEAPGEQPGKRADREEVEVLGSSSFMLTRFFDLEFSIFSDLRPKRTRCEEGDNAMAMLGGLIDIGIGLIDPRRGRGLRRIDSGGRSFPVFITPLS
jgi:hypothetical protein